MEFKRVPQHIWLKIDRITAGQPGMLDHGAVSEPSFEQPLCLNEGNWEYHKYHLVNEATKKEEGEK